MRKLLFISFLAGTVISFTGCDLAGSGNYETFNFEPAVVDVRPDMGGRIISTAWGYFAAPSLGSEYTAGDCLYMQFTIDYDNQPSKNYLTASNIVKSHIDKTGLLLQNQYELDEYTLPISNLRNMYSTPFYKGNFFILADTKNKNTNFRLIHNPEEVESDGTVNLYLQAKSSDTTNSNESTSTHYAFDLYNFIYKLGNDTTIDYGAGRKVDYYCIRANIHYVSEISEEEGKLVPEYKKNELNYGKPVEIFIFKDNN